MFEDEYEGFDTASLNHHGTESAGDASSSPICYANGKSATKGGFRVAEKQQCTVYLSGGAAAGAPAAVESPDRIVRVLGCAVGVGYDRAPDVRV